jgi:hypothetical protein
MVHTQRKVDHREGGGARFEPSFRRAGTALAERPGQPYRATFRIIPQQSRRSPSELQSRIDRLRMSDLRNLGLRHWVESAP